MARKIKEALESILACFESGDIPQAIAYSVFPLADIPSSRWSLLNRILMYISGTVDARGFRQWRRAKRHVKRGAKAIYILVPRIITRETEEGEEEEVLTGFMARPVFRVEDTDGAPLAYQGIELPELPLIERAEEWGISVKAIPGNYRCYGYFSQERKEIGLATREESVFFHELGHAAHQRISGDFKDVIQWRKEIVAELAAAVLCKLVGKTSKHLGNSFQYISHYAKTINLSPIKACIEVMGDVEKVLEVILNGEGVQPTITTTPLIKQINE
jgi:antirestriction protein ArdC